LKSWTGTEILDKVKLDLGLEDETFITAAEFLGYLNEGIDEAEAEIHKLYEGYFKTSAKISATSGTAAYSLPADIYANKLMHVDYDEGSNTTRYKVWRIKDRLKSDVEPDDDYQYDIENSTSAGPQIVFYPAPRFTNATYITLYYIRNAARLAAEGDDIDIPEFANFLIQYVKVRCLEKENHPLLQKAVMDLEQQRRQMTTTLSTMIPDPDEGLEMDMSFYEEMT
jgi:hypothetical protein